MTGDLHHQIAQAILVGMDLDEIQDAIIDPAPLEGDEKAALWLYAEALKERPRARVVTEVGDAPVLA
jgi:hypothetical protein